MPFDPSDWLMLLSLGLFCLAVLVQATYQVLHYLWWLIHPDAPLAPYVSPSSPSQPITLDTYLGPEWAIYTCVQPSLMDSC